MAEEDTASIKRQEFMKSLLSFSKPPQQAQQQPPQPPQQQPQQAHKVNENMLSDLLPTIQYATLLDTMVYLSKTHDPNLYQKLV